MLKGCLIVAGAIGAVIIGVVIYFAVRSTSAISHATVDAGALSSIRLGDSRSHVDQVLGKDGSDDTTVFGAGHKVPAGTTCRYFVINSERHLDHVPVHRLCFSNTTSRLTSVVVYRVT
jgi:hypothetical protein